MTDTEPPISMTQERPSSPHWKLPRWQRRALTTACALIGFGLGVLAVYFITR